MDLDLAHRRPYKVLVSQDLPDAGNLHRPGRARVSECKCASEANRTGNFPSCRDYEGAIAAIRKQRNASRVANARPPSYPSTDIFLRISVSASRGNVNVNVPEFVCSRRLIRNQSVRSESKQVPQILFRARRRHVARKEKSMISPRSLSQPYSITSRCHIFITVPVGKHITGFSH